MQKHFDQRSVFDGRSLRGVLEDPEFFEENRLPARSDHELLFPAEEKPRCLTLDGRWQFHYAEDLAGRSEAFVREDISEGGSQQTWAPEAAADFAEIEVPAHINLAGYGQPQYCNTAYPWDGREAPLPPHLPSKIAVGQYRRVFELPENWSDCVLRLRFEGVEPAFRCWCNGVYLGYGEDSFLPSEFALTGLLRPGKNTLAVEVYRWSSASWLEDQDFWRFWGIFRSVKLLALPEAALEDLHIRADAEGKLSLKARCAAPPDRLSARLFSPGGELLLTGELSADADAANGQYRWAEELPGALLWTGESPHLYTVELRAERAGRELWRCEQRFGFRSFALENGIMKLNGKRLVFHGVNRHEWNGKRGRVVSLEDMKSDIARIKASHINAVRTSHYPNRSEWYALCDEAGLYLIDESNVETHGSRCWINQAPERRLPMLPDGRPEWREAVLARGRRMFERDKNHPSVLIWSTGNESGGGLIFREMAEMFRRLDPDRLVHCESITYDDRYPETTDMRSSMYFPASQVEDLLRANSAKPYIQCEYAHAMGNSCGALEAYRDLEARYPHYQGAFVWDWIDQLLEKDGKLLYGGDFRERPHYGDFCANGLVFADRRPTPKLAAVRAVFAPFRLELNLREACLSVANQQLFSSLSGYQLKMEVLAEGRGARSWEARPDCAAGEKRSFALHELFDLDENWLEEARSNLTGELLLRVSLRSQEEAADENAEPHCFTEALLRSRAEAESGWRCVDGSEHLGFYGPVLGALFDKGSGLLTSLTLKGEEWLHTPLLPSFWRAPVSNDRASQLPFEKAQWKTASLYQKLAAFRLLEDGAAYVVECEYLLPTQPSGRCLLRYHFAAGEKMHVALTLIPAEKQASPLVFGLELATFPEHHRLRYYGAGPEESSSDRQDAARLGLWDLDAKKALTPYMRPQDAGLRSRTRRLDCGGLEFSGEQPFYFSALPWTPHELENAVHPWELPESQRIVLRFLGESCGVGGDDTWGARPLEEYLLGEHAHHFGLNIKAKAE